MHASNFIFNNMYENRALKHACKTENWTKGTLLSRIKMD